MKTPSPSGLLANPSSRTAAVLRRRDGTVRHLATGEVVRHPPTTSPPPAAAPSTTQLNRARAQVLALLRTRDDGAVRHGGSGINGGRGGGHGYR